MQKFKYLARNQQGKEISGVIEARSRDAVIDILRSRGLMIIKVEEDLGFNLEALKEINIGGVPMKEKVVFMRQLATMVGAGLPLTQSIEILESQAENPLFKKTLGTVLGSVQGGMGLAEAFRKEREVFDDITLNLIEAGEESGNLEVILEKLAAELEDQKKLGDKVRGAMIYPAIIFVVIALVLLLLMFVLVPAMAEIYGEFGADLPAITQFLITASNFMISYWWLILIVVSLFTIFTKYYLDSPGGKKLFNKTALKIPVIGEILVKMQVAQFTRVLSLLLTSGLSIVKALELTAGSLSNTLFKEAVLEAKKEVEKGIALAIPVARSNMFPLIVSQMIAVGEESGELDRVLERMSQYYGEEVNSATSNLTTLMDPLMLLIMGGVIAFIALAVYMPMFNLSGVVG